MTLQRISNDIKILLEEGKVLGLYSGCWKTLKNSTLSSELTLPRAPSSSGNGSSLPGALSIKDPTEALSSVLRGLGSTRPWAQGPRCLASTAFHQVPKIGRAEEIRNILGPILSFEDGETEAHGS